MLLNCVGKLSMQKTNTATHEWISFRKRMGNGVCTVSFHICVRTQRYCESEQDRHEYETKRRVWLIPTVSLRLLVLNIFYMVFTIFERQK